MTGRSNHLDECTECPYGPKGKHAFGKVLRQNWLSLSHRPSTCFLGRIKSCVNAPMLLECSISSLSPARLKYQAINPRSIIIAAPPARANAWLGTTRRTIKVPTSAGPNPIEARPRASRGRPSAHPRSNACRQTTSEPLDVAINARQPERSMSAGTTSGRLILDPRQEIPTPD
jgi:hypothetical protein